MILFADISTLFFAFLLFCFFAFLLFFSSHSLDGKLAFDEFSRWFMSSGMGAQASSAVVIEEEDSEAQYDDESEDDGELLASWTMADVRTATKIGMFSPTDLFETFSEMSKVQSDGTHALTPEDFMQCAMNIVTLGGGHDDEEQAEICDEFFALLCDDFMNHDGLLDPRAVASGLSVLCVGPRDAKVRSAFALFDVNSDGFISFDEMQNYLTSVFKVLYLASPSMETQLNGVPADTLGQVTSEQVFEQCDLNNDGRLSFEEFKEWYGTGFAQ